jgi:hypothetical protein
VTRSDTDGAPAGDGAAGALREGETATLADATPGEPPVDGAVVGDRAGVPSAVLDGDRPAARLAVADCVAVAAALPLTVVLAVMDGDAPR